MTLNEVIAILTAERFGAPPRPPAHLDDAPRVVADRRRILLNHPKITSESLPDTEGAA